MRNASAAPLRGITTIATWPVVSVVALPTIAGIAVAARMAARDATPLEVAAATIFGCVFVVLAVVDIERRVIPNRVVYPAVALALALSWVWSDREPIDALVGGVGAFVVGVAIRAFVGSGLGGGDVKMAALVGTVVGHPAVLSAAVVTALIAGLVAVLLLVSGHATRTDSFPYGPFIAAGGLVALLA